MSLKEGDTSLLLYCWFTSVAPEGPESCAAFAASFKKSDTALLLLYCCFTAALLLLYYYCFTTGILLSCWFTSLHLRAPASFTTAALLLLLYYGDTAFLLVY